MDFGEAISTIKKLSKEAKISEKQALEFLKKTSNMADLFTRTKENNQTKI